MRRLWIQAPLSCQQKAPRYFQPSGPKLSPHLVSFEQGEKGERGTIGWGRGAGCAGLSGGAEEVVQGACFFGPGECMSP